MEEEVVAAEEDKEEVAATTTNHAHLRNTTRTTIATRLAHMAEEEAEVDTKADIRVVDWMIESHTKDNLSAVDIKA